MTDSTERPPRVAYRQFTTRFDVETDWTGLARVLGDSPVWSRAVDGAWQVLDTTGGDTNSKAPDEVVP